MEVGKRYLFSSPEPKAQVSLSAQNLSVVLRRRRRCCHFVVKFSFLSPSPELLDQFQPNSLGKGESIWVMGIQICSNEGSRPFQRGDKYEIVKIL